MSRLNYFLERIEKSTELLQALEFGPSGIFTNTIIKKPKINRILKDVEGDEASLFRVIEPRSTDFNGERRIVRSDGKSIFMNDGNSFENTYKNGTKGTIVQIAQLNNEILEENFAPKLVNFDENAEMDELCKRAYQLLEKYPNLIDNHQLLKQQVDTYSQEYYQLNQSVKNLSEKINEQKHQLHTLNLELSPKKSRPDRDDDQDILDAIAREEDEIRQLQQLLDTI